MIDLLGCLFMCATGLNAIPPPVDQVSADCSAPVYASDQLVCGDPELRMLDDRLRARIDSSPEVSASAWMESHSEWFKRRSLCAFEPAHRQCLLDAYADRLNTMGYLSVPAPSGRDAICKAQSHISKVVIYQDASTESVVILDPLTSTILGVAVRMHMYQAWKPTLAFRQSGKTLDFAPHDGQGFRCHVTPEQAMGGARSTIG